MALMKESKGYIDLKIKKTLNNKYIVSFNKGKSEEKKEEGKKMTEQDYQNILVDIMENYPMADPDFKTKYPEVQKRWDAAVVRRDSFPTKKQEPKVEQVKEEAKLGKSPNLTHEQVKARIMTISKDKWGEQRNDIGVSIGSIDKLKDGFKFTGFVKQGEIKDNIQSLLQSKFPDFEVKSQIVGEGTLHAELKNK
jgi:hypothetical protein